MKPTHIRRQHAVQTAETAWEQRNEVPLDAHIEQGWTEAQVRVFWKTIDKCRNDEYTISWYESLGLL